VADIFKFATTAFFISDKKKNKIFNKLWEVFLSLPIFKRIFLMQMSCGLIKHTFYKIIKVWSTFLKA